MRTDVLICAVCSREVRIVRLNARTLALGHTTNPRNQRHAVRLAPAARNGGIPVPSTGQPEEPADVSVRTFAPPGSSHPRTTRGHAGLSNGSPRGRTGRSGRSASEVTSLTISRPGEYVGWAGPGITPSLPGRARRGRGTSKVDRLLSRIDQNGGPDSCWIWTGRVDGRGYGKLRTDYVEGIAHRLVYEAMVGPIPEGLDLDHLCRIKLCVNPAHLEPVTRKVNTQRAFKANPWPVPLGARDPNSRGRARDRGRPPVPAPRPAPSAGRSRAAGG